MDRLWQDVRYALRTLRRDVGFTIMIVVTLGIGIGINTAVFSVVRSVLLAPLPYQDPGRLAMVWTDIPEQGVHQATSAYANIEDWKAQNRVFSDLATFDPTSLTLTGGDWPEKISATKNSANLFSVLGVAPALGRTFSPEEEQQRAAVVVLSHDLWQRRFGASPDVIGQTIEIGATAFQVIGVMPEGFGFPGSDSQLWLPQTWFTDQGVTAVQRSTGPWRVLGRLNSGVSIQQARAEMNQIAARLEQMYPESNAGLRVNAVPLRDQITGSSFRLALWTLFGAVGLVLLIACANGAHMILARGMNRAQEFTLRMALGATTPRLMRQAMTESLVLAAAAGVAGLLLAMVGIRLLTALAPGNIPRLDEISIDTGVMIYTTALSLIVGILFGIAPALGLARGSLSAALREGRIPSPGGRGHLARRLLIVFQFALAIILVFGASLLVRSLLQIRGIDPGFQSANVLMANLSVESSARRISFYEQVVQNVRAVPGVRATGMIGDLFISGAPYRLIAVEGDASTEPSATPVRIDVIAGEFFRTMGVPIREGRAFSPGDAAGTVPVAIINQTMAQRFWPGESAIGKRFRTDASPSDTSWLEVVGVVADMHRQGPETAPIPQVFRPYSRDPSRNMVLLVRTDTPMPGLATAIRTRIAAIDRTVPVYSVTTVTQAWDRFLLQRRFQTFLLGLFSAIALILAALGIYGLIQYSVSQRTREIGLRIALGGSSGQVVSMIVRQGLSVALPGLAAGMVCALVLSETLSALFFGVAAFDLANIVVTSAILLLTTIVACYVPARRAARVDPMAALRDG